MDNESADAYYTYTIQLDKRGALMAYLATFGIETKIYHPILMPMQPAYSGKYIAQTTNAQKVVSRILCLPIHEKLNNSDIEFVANKIITFMKENS